MAVQTETTPRKDLSSASKAKFQKGQVRPEPEQGGRAACVGISDPWMPWHKCSSYQQLESSTSEKKMHKKPTSLTARNAESSKSWELKGLPVPGSVPQSTQRCHSLTKHLLRNQLRKGHVLGTGQLTRSLLTRKAERSTRTHVGIIKKTAWQPKMFSSRRWWILESLNTWREKTSLKAGCNCKWQEGLRLPRPQTWWLHIIPGIWPWLPNLQVCLWRDPLPMTETSTVFHMQRTEKRKTNQENPATRNCWQSYSETGTLKWCWFMSKLEYSSTGEVYQEL